MIDLNYIELTGYIASVLIAISIMMNSLVKLRVINLFGAVLFGTYGLLIGAMPVALVNYFIAITNIFYLWKMYQKSNLQTTETMKK